ncbi:MAG: hypothetical protein CVU56_05375 [Deltaproteobacteria bacterium HGW-Deltaproteobacteria-14]|jgi:septal ring factor EnvC (AmiA/AmiB activator)|nr:MAG: hypothetical protein CVU56_05375 [Deltaproteobacteria bacterium HGW-Deltaproteobacteria-14]
MTLTSRYLSFFITILLCCNASSAGAQGPDPAPAAEGAGAGTPEEGALDDEDAAPPVASLDLDTLVVDKPAVPEARHPDQDIRRLLRPERSILAATEQLDRDIRKRAAQLLWHEALEGRLSQDLTRATAEFEALTASRDAERVIVKDRLRTMIRIRSMPATRVFLRAKSYAGYQERLEALDRLYEADRRRVVAYRAQLAAWNERKRDLERRRRNLANAQETIAYLRQELTWDKEERGALELAVREQPEFNAAYAREVEALDDVLAERAKAWTDPSRQRLYTAETKGSLASPLRNGDVVRRYGIYKHPKFGTTSVSRGLLMVPNHPSERDEVRAIYWGYVAYTGWIRGLGRVVVLDHTLGYVSIYAHLDLIEVEVGQKVRTGETLGTVGDTGSFYGERLYLELRKDGKATDPLPWLRR